jgi:hypothetical protein
MESSFCPQFQEAPIPKWNGQKGAGRLKAIIWTLIFAAFVFVSVKTVPILINEYQFQDAIQNIARFATANRRTPDQIRTDVLEEAQKDDVPLRSEDIKVSAVNGNVRVSADYSITVDLLVYQWTLNLHPAVSNSALF